MDLKYFGNISNINDNVISKDVLLDGKDVTISISSSKINPNISFILDNLERMEELITHMVKQYKYNKDSVIGKRIHFYTNHHAIDLSAEDLADLIEDNCERLPIEAKLVDALYLYSINFDTERIHWNFTLGEELSNYLLIIKTNYTMNIREVSIELITM